MVNYAQVPVVEHVQRTKTFSGRVGGLFFSLVLSAPNAYLKAPHPAHYSRFRVTRWNRVHHFPSLWPSRENLNLLRCHIRARDYVRRGTFETLSRQLRVNFVGDAGGNAKGRINPFAPRFGTNDFQDARSIGEERANGIGREIPELREFDNAEVLFGGGHDDPCGISTRLKDGMCGEPASRPRNGVRCVRCNPARRESAWGFGRERPETRDWRGVSVRASKDIL